MNLLNPFNIQRSVSSRPHMKITRSPKKKVLQLPCKRLKGYIWRWFQHIRRRELSSTIKCTYNAIWISFFLWMILLLLLVHLPRANKFIILSLSRSMCCCCLCCSTANMKIYSFLFFLCEIVFFQSKSHSNAILSFLVTVGKISLCAVWYWIPREACATSTELEQWNVTAAAAQKSAFNE